jgi:ribosomal protein S4
MFKRNLPAVVAMDHRYLARHDGSEQAAGRGMGADAKERVRTPPMTPYMQMAYYPLERRLDTAIFRSLFASSVRQARQFVVHGLVKVNGKKVSPNVTCYGMLQLTTRKMVYPGYALNPGDMFQVEPSSVMFATGAPKTQSGVARRIVRERAAQRAEEREQNGGQTPKQPKTTDTALTQPTREEPTPAELKKQLQDLMEQVDGVLAEDVGAKDKQKFRALRQSIRKAISLWRTANPETISTLDTQFDFIKNQIAERSAPSSLRDSATPAEPLISEEDQARLRSAFDKLRLETEHTSAWNKRNARAPYATPWRPRDYMSAFAFIPRYLEVNQNICAAVYLRHPVARQGLAEVPTPFHIETGQLAFNWYLRNR